MAKKTQKLDSKKTIQDGFNWRTVGLLALLIVSLVIIFWPVFLVSELRQYPECIAYDLFPVQNGFPSDGIKSFFYFIHTPLVVIGLILFAFSVSLFRKGVLVPRDVARILVYGILAVVVIGVLVLYAGFDLGTEICKNYQTDQLPDFQLIIDSSK